MKVAGGLDGCGSEASLGVTRFFFCLFAFSRAAPMAYGGSQTRGRIGVVSAGLHHSHSNVGAEPPLRPTSQLTATPDL